MKKLPKHKKGAWFVRIRGSYLPVGWQGWLTYLPYIWFLIASYLFVVRTSPGLAEVVIRVVPYWLSAVIIMHWIAGRKS
jgi:hypothetical protein